MYCIGIGPKRLVLFICGQGKQTIWVILDNGLVAGVLIVMNQECIKRIPRRVSDLSIVESTQYGSFGNMVSARGECKL